ncbi:MAG: heparinase II/III family protein [Candidatus Nealsonbacteria bacterium]|nr:heparinase II/III family protein [Candidatus Nealsonbacteria bacterium]
MTRTPLHLSSPLTLAAILWATIPLATIAAEPPALDPARIDELAGSLPEAPCGVGPMIGDRQLWQAAADAPGFKDVIAQAESLLKQPIPELTDELFLDYSRTGNRTRCQRVLSQRHGRVSQLVLAECLENRGRFLPAIEEAIRAVCSEKTWVLPAHDGALRNFKGTVNEIDLRVAGFSWTLATVDHWLGDKLSAETRKLIRDELEKRTFTPFEDMINKGTRRSWWLTGTNNWNAVCLAGVTGSALAIIESPKRRAFFIAAAEKYVEYFLSGFTADGYCSEGVGYWNYGFGHYVMLAETVHQATGGKLDLLAPPRIRPMALFGRRMEIAPGIYPALADCSVGSQPDTRIMAFLSRRYRVGLKQVEAKGLLLAGGPTTALVTQGLFGFPNSASKTPPLPGPTPPQPLRDWFPDAGVLICRPAGGDAKHLAVAIKGGHNAEHHNHNDVGTFLVALAGQTPLVDPGAEVYTQRTFSSRRYESDVLNSLGHPVPRVAGKLQRTGRAAAGKVLKTEFTDETDTIVLDLKAAYAVESLKKLQRTFVFSRQGRGSLTVTDEVEFDTPQEFGAALITFSRWKQLASYRLLIGEGSAAVEVTIDTGGLAKKIVTGPIEEDVRGGRPPTRMGIDLMEPVTNAVVTLTIAPAGR